MKTLLIAVLCLACFVGCSKGKTEVGRDFQQNTKTVVIDGCEYLMFIDIDRAGYAGYGFAALAHKGNCKFCEKRHAQQK